VTPEEFALAADDEGRTVRTGIVRDGGTFELRYRDGELTLSRGDIVLLRAPLAGTPDEVYLEGKAVVCGIAAVRSNGLPAAVQPVAPEQENPAPASLSWTEKLTAEGRFERSPDGSVLLAADKAAAAGWVTTPLTSAEIREVVLELDEATPGAGVFLGRQDGEPREVVRFVSDPAGQRVHVKLQTDNSDEARMPPIDKAPVALAPGKAWIRLLYGCGVLRTWISCDGRHWAQPYPAAASLTGPVTALGLHHVPKSANCRIRLRRVRSRTLPELAALADAALLARAPALHDAPQLGVWLTKVCEAQPPEADGAAWRRSCAVRTLGAGCARDLGTALLELLLDDAADRGLPSERRLALLNEAALLWDTGDHGLLQKLLQRYRDLGRDAHERSGLRPYSAIRRDLMSVPLVTPHRVQVADEPLIRAELIQLAHENRLDELHAFCRQLHYFRQQDICPLRKWAEVVSSRTTVGRMNWARRATVSNDWQPPLIEELSKETYNAVAEMNALLESAAFADAARLIASLDAEMFQGVAPHVSDRRLLASLPTAVGMALDAWPDLRAAVQAQYGEMAAFRVRRAIQEDSLAAVQLATVQFAGLPAAAEAHRWLGDRALSIGWFDHALAQYRQAALSADAGDVRDLAARHRLAAAMLGRELGKPPASEVEIGGTKLTPAAFEELVAQLLKQNALLPAAALGNPSLGRAVPKPSGFAVQTRSRLDGPIGREPNAEVVPNSRRLAVDWAGRQIAAVLDVNAIYVSNRFQVAAYDPNSGARVWQSQTPDGNPMRSQDWGLIRMRPLVTADRIITRLLYGPQPTLACLDRGNGQLAWTVEFGAQEAPVSDPLWLQGRLGVLTLARQETGESLLRWTILDPSSGVVISQNELLRLSETWWRRQCCEVTPLDDGLVAILSGVTVCCDVAGNLRWIRRETVLPPSEEPSWVRQAFQGPLLAGNDLYVLQPGGCAVARLDVRSGRVAWSRLLPGAQRLLGLADQRLIVQTDRGLLTLAAATGDSQWLHPVEDFLDACLCDDAMVLYARRQPAEDAPGKFRPQLVWLDAATGQPLAQTLLRGIEHEKPFLGPLVMSGDRLWAFFGRGDQDPTRDLIELVPQGEAEKSAMVVANDLWTRHIPPPLQLETSRMLGDWRWLAAELAGAKPVEPNRWGEAESLGIRARRLVPATLGRRTSLPAGSSPKLRLRVGNDPNQPWNLEIRMNGTQIVRREFSSQTDPQPWKQLELDLRPAAGATGWLTIEAQTREGQETADVFWKQVEIAF
jgi:outer membrane protein assembly factor BamB